MIVSFSIEEKIFKRFKKLAGKNVSRKLRGLILAHLEARENENFKESEEVKIEEIKKNFDQKCIGVFDELCNAGYQEEEAIKKANKILKKVGEPWATFDIVKRSIKRTLKERKGILRNKINQQNFQMNQQQIQKNFQNQEKIICNIYYPTFFLLTNISYEFNIIFKYSQRKPNQRGQKMKREAKISKKYDEFRVRLVTQPPFMFIDGKYQAGADYFTYDKTDAQATAQHMVDNLSLIHI
eukprot:TRINITY_DN27389_c0_g2_i3.p1 TRINITY_DN27389_c0_g2~~TRINITY_DN27389_c0_g2_i3.p1  ORF type:complete len:239 (-),score=28.30 TRINITY_DN27389_c0_g2_i3:120-836(-)